MISRAEVLAWLRTEGEEALAPLWERADRVRRQRVGDAVHLRGLVDISNHCVRECAYCGLAAGREGLGRYRMSADEVLACARLAERFGYGTLVLQAGEDYGLTAAWVEALVRRLREETPLAVTLSLGERKDEELARWRRAGADRYLLRFETGNRDLYDRIHPPLGAQRADRLAELGRLRELGYEV
ncbi:MAG TPA: radical SAM protein, partial [Thermoanaerobaculia bacterium]|nr:radical SAM protein [Thermoanaerobaculia bacterium]